MLKKTILFLLYTAHIQSLNILFITWRFPHISQTFIQDQIIYLIKHTHNPTIQSLRKNKIEKIQPDFYKYNLFAKITHGSKLTLLNNIDLLYIQFGNIAVSFMEEIKKNDFKGPIIVCFRGNDLSGYLKQNPHIYDELFCQADLFLPVCDFFKNRLIQLGCPPEKIITHHSAINTQKFRFKQRKIIKTKQINIISVARIAPKKGLEYSLRSIALLKKQFPHIHFTIIGDAQENHIEYKKYLYKLVEELDLKNHVTFHGWATANEILKKLDQSDIFILPSVTADDGDQEGIPNALKEAMAVGLPVIATDHAGNSELIDHMKSGILVAEKDYQAVADAMEWIISNPEKVNLMCTHARKKIEDEFDIEAVVTKLETIFADAIEKKRRETS